MPYLTTIHSLDTGHQFAFDKAQIIGKAQTRADRLFIEAICSEDNLINKQLVWRFFQQPRFVCHQSRFMLGLGIHKCPRFLHDPLYALTGSN